MFIGFDPSLSQKPAQLSMRIVPAGTVAGAHLNLLSKN